MLNDGSRLIIRTSEPQPRWNVRLYLAALALVLIVAIVALARADDDASTAAKRAAMVQEIISGDRAVAFRTMDQVYPYRVISLGNGPIAQLPRALRKLNVTYEFEGSHGLDDLLTRSRTQGFLVIKDGNIVDERYFLGADENSRFASWSAAKSFTSTLVGLALADGKIGAVTDPITQYLSELKGTGYEGASIRDILEMSSGVEFTEVNEDPTSDIWKMWATTMTDESATIAEYAQSRRRHAQRPGTQWVYRSIDSAVLGMLVNRVTGEPLAEMLSRRIWQPLGMEHDATWLTDRPGGLEAGYCCINATLRDYGRFGLMFLHRGKSQGKSGDTQVVPAKWIGDATNPQGPLVRYGALYPDAFPDSPIGYGYQWWIPAGGDDHPYTAWGLCYQFIYVSPKYNLVIAKTSASQDWASYPGLSEETMAFEAIGRYLENGQ